MDAEQTLGLTANGGPLSRESRSHRLRQVNLQLAAAGLPAAEDDGDYVDVARGVLDSFRAQARLLADVRCPADQRIEAFLADHFADQNLDFRLRLPARALVLGRHGIARELSLPAEGDKVVSPLLTSYRLHNGVLHNPKSDRRTTQGTFHVVEGGLPVPFDKFAVPKRTFAEMFRHAMAPPDDLLVIPLTNEGFRQAKSFVSLLLRPTVVPAVPKVGAEAVDGGAVLRAGVAGQQPRLRRVDLRQRGRPVPAGQRRRPGHRALDRPHGLRGPRAAPGAIDEEATAPAALGRRDRAAAARTACAGAPRTSGTTTAVRSS